MKEKLKLIFSCVLILICLPYFVTYCFQGEPAKATVKTDESIEIAGILASQVPRKKLGKDKIIGVSAQTVEQAVMAEKHGADYLGVGAVFPTSSKDDAQEVDYETLKAICQAVQIPVIAIGGINAQNVDRLKGSGICGVAVISAIFAQEDIKEAAKELKNRTKEATGI